MKKPFKYRFPTVLLSLTLVLAIVVSGLTSPGFLLPLFGDKAANTETTSSQKDPGERTEAEKQAFVKGNSKAFSIEPVSGVKISAEENALDKDREFRFEDADAEKIEKYSSVLTSEICNCANLEYVWHLDAGLADDDLLPGTFKMSFDLQQLGIDPSKYGYTSVFRIDDSGKWYEYASGLDGSVLTVDSNQNCDIALVTIFVIFTPIAVDSSLILASNGFFYDSEKYSADVNIDGKKRFKLYWKPDEILSTIQQNCNRITKKILNAAEERTKEELTQRFGSDRINDMYPDGKYNKGFKYENDGITINKEKDNIAKEHDKVFDSYVTTIKNSDDEYLKLEQQIREINRNPRKVLDGKEQSFVLEAKESCERAYPFLKEQIKTDMPTHVVCIELTPNLPSNGVTISPFLGHPYCIISTVKPYMLLTITHELFHISERTYVFNSRANYKFDEALAQAVEADAYDYYYSKGIVKDSKEKCQEALYEYQHYALELDNYGEKFDPKETFPDGTFNGDSTNSCYPVGDFILYLKDNVLVGGNKVEYYNIMSSYKSMWRNGSMAEILKKVFSLNDEQLNKSYLDFVSKKRTNFYASALNSGDTGGFTPSISLKDKKAKIEITNKNYVTRVRKIAVEKRSINDEEFAVVLKKDDGFDEKMSDYTLIPLQTKEELKYQQINGGIFFAPKKFRDSTETADWFMIETDGGISAAGTKSGYTLYPVFAPDAPKVKLENGTLTVEMPNAQKSPSYEVADGYVLSIYSDGKLKDTIKIDKSQIQSNTFSQAFANAAGGETVTISEWFADPKNKGPESKPVNLDGNANGKWTLTKSFSHTPENLVAGQFNYQFKADGSNFYFIYDEDTRQKNHNVFEGKATFDNLPQTIKPGEKIQIKINETVLQRAGTHGAEYDTKYHEYFGVSGFYRVNEEVISAFKKEGTYDGVIGAKLDVSKNDELADCTRYCEITIPNEKGDTDYLMLTYYYGPCKTFYIYKWTT